MASSELPGTTRNVVKGLYAVFTPAGFTPSYLAGWQKAVCNVLISPAMGARFTQLLVTLEHDGQCLGNTGENQYLIYVLEGNASILLDGRRHRLEPGSYVYLPTGKDVEIKGAAGTPRILIFQKRFEPLAGEAAPPAIVGHEREIRGQPFSGCEDARLQALLPHDPAFDMAVNLVSFQPGASLPFVGSHVMEQGLVLLRGQGIFRLDSDWHPVQAGDGVWTAPYCPQWFVAIGKTPATYICYQNVNREPM
jgi:(S)-ureidoglycine aminohydrolase